LIYMTADEEEKYNIATAIVPLDEKGNIIPKKVEARMKANRKSVPRMKSIISMFLPSRYCRRYIIDPFLQNDDANRALMVRICSVSQLL